MQDIRNIKFSIDTDVVKKIFGNTENAKSYLLDLWINTNELKGLSAAEIYSLIVANWQYEKSKDIIRKTFKMSKKYAEWKSGERIITTLLNEWKERNLWSISWPFSQWKFDEFVQSLNSENTDRDTKDNKVKVAAVRYRRIKEINTVRNDFLETIIFEQSQNIIPTLSHSKGVDFFIDWISFDQKVARSPTTEFKQEYWDNWKEFAKNNPHIVAQYLYQYQDEWRFWHGPRLYVVYLDEDIQPIKIKQTIEKIDLSHPSSITFSYKHKTGWIKTYQTQAFTILLHN